MKEMPLVSIIVPVFNGEAYVKNCLENLLGQTYKNLEIIVIDDGSEDATLEIINQFPIKIIRQTNMGVSVARNVAIDNAKGTFIHFMDVDDRVNGVFYEKMVEAIELNHADMACCGMTSERDRKYSNTFKKMKVFENTADKLKATYVGKIGYVWRYLYRTDFLRKYNFKFEAGRLVEDAIFAMKTVYFAKKLVVVPLAHYTYVNHQNSQLSVKSAQKQAKLDDDWLHAKAQVIAFAQKNDFKIPGINTGKLVFSFWKLKNYWLNLKRK